MTPHPDGLWQIEPVTRLLASIDHVASATDPSEALARRGAERQLERGDGLAESLGTAAASPWAYSRPRPEEAAQPVALRPRHDVHVEVGDALADDVVVGDERALRAQRHGHGGSDQLHPLEERPDVRQLGQRHDVLRRDDEHVPGEQRRPVEERHGDVVAVDDLGQLLAGDDGAEGATGAHARLTGSPAQVASSPSSRTYVLSAAGIHHRAGGPALQQGAVGHSAAFDPFLSTRTPRSGGDRSPVGGRERRSGVSAARRPASGSCSTPRCSSPIRRASPRSTTSTS